MTSKGLSWGAGIVNHGSYDDLECCLASLARQTNPPSAVFVFDTGENPTRFAELRASHSRSRDSSRPIEFEEGSNLGFAGGANRVVARLRETGSLDFVLVMNPDIELEPDFAERLIESMVASPGVAIATGKLLRGDRRTIDSAGIVFPRHRRPRDRGSEEPDRGQYERAERVDAVSGAAMLLRVDTLDSLTLEGELFDERFFAYHEDTDLCWRARRFGYEVLYEPSAVALHARGWQRARRAEVPVIIRRHSFKNHYLQLIKNETLGGFLVNLPWLVAWEVLRLGFVLLRERDLMGGYGAAWREVPEARRKRKLIRARSTRRIPVGSSQSVSTGSTK